jgi:DUF2914 family protein
MRSCLARRVRGLSLAALASRVRLGYRNEAVKKPTALFALAAILVLACDDPPSTSAATPASAAPIVAPIATATARPTASAAAPTPTPTPPLQVLKLTLTSDVKQKEPVDELKEAGPGQRVWAHVTIRNRAGEARRVSVVFKVGGEERSTVDLQIASSWSYRTWAYNTLRAGDKSGELTVEIRDDGGNVLSSAKLPIKVSNPHAK